MQISDGFVSRSNGPSDDKSDSDVDHDDDDDVVDDVTRAAHLLSNHSSERHAALRYRRRADG